MRDWINARCACDQASSSDVTAFLLAIPGISCLVASFWSIGLF